MIEMRWKPLPISEPPLFHPSVLVGSKNCVLQFREVINEYELRTVVGDWQDVEIAKELGL